MPTHLHAIVFHESFRPEPLVSVLTDFRKFTGRRIADYAQEHLPGCMSDVFLKNAGEDRERRVWQPSRHPVQIETEKFRQTKSDYLHDNPVRKGLVARPQHWRFSSASYWYPLDATSPAPTNDVILTPIEW
jgi:hypothetical protein